MSPFGAAPFGCAPPPLDSLWTAFYWHFGIGVNVLWVAVPLWLCARAAADASSGAAILLAHEAGAAQRGRDMMARRKRMGGSGKKHDGVHTKVA